MMCLAVSPIPMGQTLGLLLRAVRRQDTSGAMLAGSTSSVQRCLATRASEWHSSVEADLKEVHSLLHQSASTPEGPATPLVCRAEDLIIAASKDSNRTGCISGGSSSMTASGCAG